MEQSGGDGAAGRTGEQTVDERADTTMVRRAVLVVLGAVVLALPVRDALGEAGLTGLLLLTLWAVAVLGYADLTGRPVPRLGGLAALRLPGRAPAPAAPVVEDVWRSERWIGEAVARGLRALDEWRLEQNGA